MLIAAVSCRCSWVVVTQIVAGMESNRKKMMTSFLVPYYIPFLFVCIFLIVFDSCRAEPILNLNATEPKNRIDDSE